MFKVNPDGSIECSTADEALDLQRRIQERTAKAQRQHERSQPTLFAQVAQTNGHEPQNEIVKKLLDFRGTTITSEQIMPIIGAKALAGVGPKMYHLRRRIPALNALVDEQKDERG